MADPHPSESPAPVPPTDTVYPDERVEHIRARHERRDVGFAPVMAFVVVSILGGAVILFLVWNLFHQGERYAEKADAKRQPLAAPRTVLPEEPRLEQLDRASGLETGNRNRSELGDLQKLDRYGATPEDGFVHIPIDEAMSLIVNELPVRESGDPEDYRSFGLEGDGESNSGRMFRGRQ